MRHVVHHVLPIGGQEGYGGGGNDGCYVVCGGRIAGRHQYSLNEHIIQPGVNIDRMLNVVFALKPRVSICILSSGTKFVGHLCLRQGHLGVVFRQQHVARGIVHLDIGAPDELLSGPDISHGMRRLVKNHLPVAGGNVVPGGSPVRHQQRQSRRGHHFLVCNKTLLHLIYYIMM